MPKPRKILNNFQRRFLREFAKNDLFKYFYWSGGTALAYLYLNHRYSEDLDFLSEELLPDDYLLALVKELAKSLQIDKIEQRKIYNRHEFIFHKNKQSLKLEFVYYPFRNYRRPRILKEFGIKVSSLEDIAINKVHALSERQEPKDVFDLYWLLKKKKLTLDRLLRLVKKKFDLELDLIILSAQALKAIDRIKDIQPLIIHKADYHQNEMKRYFQEQANQYLRKQIK
jgi:predicted nucleotidyltransferase component of viral defense system